VARISGGSPQAPSGGGSISPRLARDLVHVDTIIRRWPALTGGRAHHGASGGNLANLADAVEGANAA